MRAGGPLARRRCFAFCGPDWGAGREITGKRAPLPKQRGSMASGEVGEEGWPRSSMEAGWAMLA
jgi:hypothetical protein